MRRVGVGISVVEANIVNTITDKACVSVLFDAAHTAGDVAGGSKATSWRSTVKVVVASTCVRHNHTDSGLTLLTSTCAAVCRTNGSVRAGRPVVLIVKRAANKAR